MNAPALLLLILPGLGWANGQTTHIWITREARGLVPAGPLRDIVQDEALQPMLVHGTMFPDGGYAVGHPYGEAAHWEPFQTAYLAWIRATYGPPYEDVEARQHVAFLMGLASHGMADQTFDAHYLNRSQTYDGPLGWAAGDSMDEATDFEWGWLTGPQDVPDRWVPGGPFVELYAEQGIVVDDDTMNEGQGLLELAVRLVGLGSQSEISLERYREGFPWATSHLQDDSLPGIPSYEAEVIAGYWQEVWDRLHEMSPTDAILRTVPEEGGWIPALDPAEADARLTVHFKRGLVAEDIVADAFLVTGPDGPLAVEPWLYYGNDSHIVHLVPVAPWPEDALITVTVKAGLPDRFGGALAQDTVFTVTTTEPPPEDTACTTCGDDDEDNVQLDEDEGPKARCGGCSAEGEGRAAGLGLLGLGIGLRLRRRGTARPLPATASPHARH
jgi:MYXO-CTERM domain-containing protein